MYINGKKEVILMASKKITLTLEEKVLKNIDDYAKTIGVSRSAAITFLVAQGLQMAYYPEMVKQLEEMMKTVK